MTTALEQDPYLLPVPTPASPVVLPHWITEGNTSPNSTFRDGIWQLGPLIDRPSLTRTRITWELCPLPLLPQVKQVAWTMINGQLRPSYIKQRGLSARARSGPAEMGNNCREWMRLAQWMYERDLTALHHLDDTTWTAYLTDRVSRTPSRAMAEQALHRLTDLWAFDQLSQQPTGVPRPPWTREDIETYLPDKPPTDGENTTEPLDPAVIGPLLIWAVRLVDEFSDDIIAAWEEFERLQTIATTTPSIPAGRRALEAFLRPPIAAGLPLPTIPYNGTNGLASSYIAGTVGCSKLQVRVFRQKQMAGQVLEAGACPLQVPVTGRIAGQLWRERIDFSEAAQLMRHLGTAAMIICLYLTGMRPQEVQGLRSGCCPAPDPGHQHHLIWGRHYKNVTDADGNHTSAGAEREVPWVAIAPVVRAIRVLERMVPDGEFLLHSKHHDVRRRRSFDGVLKSTALDRRIRDFVDWANQEAAQHQLPHETIPEDAHGPIGVSRFRRTLAWHVARRPGGLVALAIQYGHLRAVLDARTSSGYGSRSRRGLHSVLDIETALAAADSAARLRDRLAAGEKISGPAARRALTATTTVPRFEGRLTTAKFARQAANYLARDGLVLFDNPDAHLFCVFKRDTALCEPGPSATAPRPFDCRPGCANAVRLDQHAQELLLQATETERLSAHTPDPLARHLHATAERLRATAAHHTDTAHSAEDLT